MDLFACRQVSSYTHTIMFNRRWAALFAAGTKFDILFIAKQVKKSHASSINLSAEYNFLIFCVVVCQLIENRYAICRQFQWPK